MNKNKHLDLGSLINGASSNPAALNAKSLRLVKLVEDAVDCINKIAPEKYPEFYIKLSVLLHGEYVTEDIYDYAVSLMKNVDGTHGPKLTKDKILECAKLQGLVPAAQYSDFDIAYIANMYASDNWDVSLSDEDNIAFVTKVTKGFLTDPDAPQQPGRALRFFTKIAMWHPAKSK